MTPANGTMSSRKPSASSSQSGGHSPSDSPNSATHAQRNHNPSNNVFGVGGIKGLNNGWQVWGNGTPSSKRNASISSIASATETAQQSRSPITDAWSKPATPGNGWDGKDWEIDVGSSPTKKDLSQIARQRQAGSRTVGLNDDSLETSFSSRYEHNGNSVRYSLTSPTKTVTYASASSAFSAQHSTSMHYDATQANSAESDMTLGMGNLSIVDGYENSHRAKGQNGIMPGVNPQIRAPIMHQPRGLYNPYPQQPDYNSYYSPAPPQARDGFVDYSPYGYDTYRNSSETALYSHNVTGAPNGTAVYATVPPQGLHPHNHPELHRTPSSVFYPEYNAQNRIPTASPYFYSPHPQAMVYHPPPQSHSPMSTTQISAAVATAASLSDKKRELQNMQYTLQQQQQQLSHQQNMIVASIRHSPSPHSQSFPQPVDYTGQIITTPLYGRAIPIPHGLHPYQPHIRPGRRSDSDPNPALRSALLEEFRANKARKWELRDIFGFVVEFSGDQHGSRFIQQKLESASPEEKQIIFDEIIPDNALQLIQDVFGNYVIQKLFEHGTQVQKTILANTMEGHILLLSLQMYGCRVVQKAVEYILPEQQAAFVKELDGHVLKCVKDANGNHVIQKLIERVPPERLAFINAFSGCVYELSTHPYGCRVLQRCFEHLTEEQTRPLLDELHKYTINLMQDQFGNYVIQFVLEHGKSEDRTLIISKLRGQMLHMARHKFASNVCEKALVTADSESRRLLIDEIMTPKQDGVSPIVTMMKDQFANYVLQRALTVVEGEQKDLLVSKIKPQLFSMRKYSSAYSKHLISIEKLLLDKSSSSSKLNGLETDRLSLSAATTPDHSSISIPTSS